MTTPPANPLQSFEIGTGAWSWGDKLVWGYGSGYSAAEVHTAFVASIGSGIRFFDTAEMYGFGQSERLLGQFRRDSQQNVLVATKFMPLPWRWRRSQLVSALRGSLRRLGMTSVDLYQIHWPSPPRPVEFWADALADVVEAGLTRSVGVSNYSRAEMQRTMDTLAKRGISLTSNQVEYNLLQRGVERSGLLKMCHELDVRLIAYSPIAMGMLSGKYSADNRPLGIRRWNFYGKLLPKLPPLLDLLREIGDAHNSKTPAQVALNWTISKGTLPIPGAKNARQAEQNAGALGWRLTADEVAKLDEASERLTARE